MTEHANHLLSGPTPGPLLVRKRAKVGLHCPVRLHGRQSRGDCGRLAGTQSHPTVFKVAVTRFEVLSPRSSAEEAVEVAPGSPRPSGSAERGEPGGGWPGAAETSRSGARRRSFRPFDLPTALSGAITSASGAGSCAPASRPCPTSVRILGGWGCWSTRHRGYGPAGLWSSCCLLSFGQRTGFLSVNLGAAIRLPRAKQTLSERILDVDAVLHLLALERNPAPKRCCGCCIWAACVSARCLPYAAATSPPATIAARSPSSARAARPGRCCSNKISGRSW